jgi:transcriptional regulator
VHVTGTIRIVDDYAAALAILRASVEATERSGGTNWDIERSLAYVRSLLPGITAFTITVRTVNSTFKLSQNQPSAIQRRVHATLAASGRGRDRELAALMADALGLGTAPNDFAAHPLGLGWPPALGSHE